MASPARLDNQHRVSGDGVSLPALVTARRLNIPQRWISTEHPSISNAALRARRRHPRPLSQDARSILKRQSSNGGIDGGSELGRASKRPGHLTALLPHPSHGSILPSPCPSMDRGTIAGASHGKQDCRTSQGRHEDSPAAASGHSQRQHHHGSGPQDRP